MAASNIVTDRLMIIPMNYPLICAVLENRYDELTDLGINRNIEWPRQDTLDVLNFLKGAMRDDDEVSGFDVWMIGKKRTCP